jgi:DNA invertase Pin-like site-specific DNA recombinase
MKNKCLAYIRYSDYGLSKDEQLSGVSNFIEANDLKLVMKIEDQDSMEDLTRHEKFQQVLSSGLCDVVLVLRLDRLGDVSTSISETVNFINQLTEMGVRFISALDNIDSESNGGQFLKAIDKAVSSSKSIIKGERVHLALSNARMHGESVGRPKERDDLQILALRNQGLTVRQIADRLTTSVRTVSRALSENAETLDAPQ